MSDLYICCSMFYKCVGCQLVHWLTLGGLKNGGDWSFLFIEYEGK